MKRLALAAMAALASTIVAQIQVIPGETIVFNTDSKHPNYGLLWGGSKQETLRVSNWWPDSGIEIVAPDGQMGHRIEVRIPYTSAKWLYLSYDGYDGSNVHQTGMLSFYLGGNSRDVEVSKSASYTFVGSGELTVEMADKTKKPKHPVKPKLAPKPWLPGPPPPWMPIFPGDPGYVGEPWRKPKNGDRTSVDDPTGPTGTNTQPTIVTGTVPPHRDGSITQVQVAILGSGGSFTFDPGVPEGAVYTVILYQQKLIRDEYVWQVPPTLGQWRFIGVTSNTAWFKSVQIDPPGSKTITQITGWDKKWLVGPLG